MTANRSAPTPLVAAVPPQRHILFAMRVPPLSRRLAAGFLALVLAGCANTAEGDEPRLDTIRLPPGFAIEVYARVPGARSMAVDERLGVAFVGTRGSDVYAVRMEGNGSRPPQRVFSDLKVANGIDVKDGYLYVAEQHRLTRYRAPDLATLARSKPEVLSPLRPDKSHHGWRYIRFGPDGMLYVAIGAPCNICAVKDWEATIVRVRPEGGTPEVFAKGVRNSVGFDFQPSTGEMYFTDNGADWMGDDSPPDELNHAPRAGMHFGFPWYGGGADRTPEFRNEPPPAGTVQPVVKFGAHVAALGMSFYRGTMFPEEYRGDAFVAQRGSWNRSKPDGYRVARVRFDKKTGKATGWEPFAEGWLQPGGYWGRLVDVKELPDGSLLVSDNHADAIYRIYYKGK